MWIETAYALGGGFGGGGGGGPSPLGSFLPFILVFAVIYFLMIRPQQKQKAEMRMMLDSLEEGDRVLTSGGIYGVVTKLKDDVVWLQIAEQVRIRVQRSAIAARSGRASLKKVKGVETKEAAEEE